ncbi:prepilin peptidase [Streptomyces caniscabiei]|uniref:prepilin peptidase n=1 Tax=Streptomyces caniscabiei TaxID=2746961 RepID=UPI0029BA5212|nr:prepilin peptidase [Streptomyces caniscabiei]MDX2776301.1 prepilin peptidase [Streptomyces caniscabiei]
MDILLISVLAVLGLCAGSFAGATVWRLRAKQLVEDKAEGEEVDKGEYDALLPLTKVTTKTDRSRCLHCGHTLQWYDLLPLVSWASAGGKCRYCHERIGWFEPLMELGMAALFVLSFWLWPYAIQTPTEVGLFSLWIVTAVLLIILFAYDLKWFLLPNKVMFPLIFVTAIIAVLQILLSPDWVGALISMAIGIAILSGLYLLLWLISKGEWIGFGDVKLGLALALILADWQLAFLALFAANFFGMMIVLPGMLMGKITRQTRVPFGPLLTVGALFSFFFGRTVIQWYLSSPTWL